MKHIVASLLLAGGAMFLIAPAAEAHPDRYGARDHHGHHGHHGYHGHRVKFHRGHMPRWLKRDRPFRAWYRHSHFKYNPRLDWRELYDIYRWERRYYTPRRYKHYGHHPYREYRYDDDYRDGRRHERRRHRD